MKLVSKRRAPTEEQRAAAAERRDRMRKIAAKISAMSEAERTELVGGGVATIEGRALSLFNTCMILSQMPASVVGGFQQWRKAGRVVRKGEHGAAIWIPISAGDKAEPTAEDAKSNRPRFMLGTVFDISQTEEAQVPVEVA